MADSALAPDRISDSRETQAPKSSLAIVPFVLATVIAALLAIGVAVGTLFWLIHSGRLAKIPITTVTVAPQPLAPASSKSHALAMEPLLVNLADQGGQSYLRVGIVLRIEDADTPKDKEEKPAEKGGKAVNEGEAALRDVALNVISRQTTDELLSTEGKEALKQKLKAAMLKSVPELKVTEVFFTEFLVQR
jgi:flagellar FliL protein